LAYSPEKAGRGVSMKAAAFILAAAGTLGLLAGEFLTDFGRGVTLLFAAMNLLGLCGIAVHLFGMRNGPTTSGRGGRHG
jgi:hypothetical protein